MGSQLGGEDNVRGSWPAVLCEDDDRPLQRVVGKNSRFRRGGTEDSFATGFRRVCGMVARALGVELGAGA